MKNKTLIAVAISLIAVVSTVSAQQIVRPVPASSITSNRVTSVYVAPVQDLSGYALSSDVTAVIQNNGTRAWTSYFLGQRFFTQNGQITIKQDGTLFFASFYGGNPLVAQALGNFPTSASNGVEPTCQGGTSISFTAIPLFTNAAALVGGPPYAWTASSATFGASGCNGGGVTAE